MRILLSGDFDESVSDRTKNLFAKPLTDFEIFGIVNMGNRRSDDDRETVKVAQLPFSIHEKKSELKSSEMQIASEGNWKSSKHGIMWARTATFT